MFKFKHKEGFTLVELLVVIAIIGLLASIVLVSLNTVRTKARDTKRIADLKQIQLALEMYYDDVGNYPVRDRITSTASAWTSGLGNDLSAYITAIPKDPTNSGNLRYYYDSEGTGYGLMCAMEHSGNYPLVDDGGDYNNTSNGRYYEIGPDPPLPGNWW